MINRYENYHLDDPRYLKVICITHLCALNEKSDPSLQYKHKLPDIVPQFFYRDHIQLDLMLIALASCVNIINVDAL